MFDLFIVGLVAFVVYAVFSAWKQNNPEKWAKFQRELKESEAKSYAELYEKALKRVPGSEWILMTREEKADVLRAREKLDEDYSALSMEARKILADRYGITPEDAARMSASRHRTR